MLTLNTMRVHVLLVILCMQCALLNGMGSIIDSVGLSTENNKSTLWEVIIQTCLSRDDYDAHRNVAMVSTMHNKLVEDIYRSKKKLIEKFLLEDYSYKQGITGTRNWNKDFSQCAWVRIYDMADYYYHLPRGDNKRLEFILVGCGNDDSIKKCDKGWDKCYFPIFEDNVRPFFNKKGQACFYGYGNIVMSKRDVTLEHHWTDGDSYCSPQTTTIQDTKQGVVEYCIDIANKSEEFYCSTVYIDGSSSTQEVAHDNPRDPLMFLHFPILLKALLQSADITNIPSKGIGCSAEKRFCHIKEITIPENYKTYKRHVAFTEWLVLQRHKETQYTSCGPLPKEIKDTFDEIYAEQQKKK